MNVRALVPPSTQNVDPMTPAVHATTPYGHHLQTYHQDEVIQKGVRYVVSHVRYRNDGDARTEIERHQDPGDGHLSLSGAVAAAESGRKEYLDTEAEEMAAAAAELRAQEYAYHVQQPDDPPDFEPWEELCGSNTRIEYLYRDAGNFKQYEVIVVAGVLNEQQQQELRNSLRGDCFIPEQVGMRPLQPDLQSFGPGQDDAWHEIVSISITDEPATFPGTAGELLAKFRATYWDPSGSGVGRIDVPAAGAVR